MEDIIRYYELKNNIIILSDEDLLLEMSNNTEEYIDILDKINNRENLIFSSLGMSFKLYKILGCLNVEDEELSKRINIIKNSLYNYINGDELSKEYLPFNWSQVEEKRRLLKRKGFACSSVSEIMEYVKYDYAVIKSLYEHNDTIFAVNPKCILSTINKVLYDYKNEEIDKEELFEVIKCSLNTLYTLSGEKDSKKLWNHNCVTMYSNTVDNYNNILDNSFTIKK